MLDIRKIRENPDILSEALKNRNMDIDLKPLLDADAKRRAILSEVEDLKNTRNTVSKEIGAIRKSGGDASAIMEEMRSVGEKISNLDSQIAELDSQIEDFLMRIPNLPSDTTPIGKDETENVEQRRNGTPRTFDFEAKAHWDIGTDLGILDFESAAKISGARFTVYKGLGARLERSIINFYMDEHSKNGYTEILPPYMVTRATMTGTGQLPKFEDDAYKVDENTFLIPTAEVPVTNLYRGDILDGDKLPIRNVA